ncbi:ArnT family glycosyltransferase [Haladaptatus sp. CMSO5]|uniref:ArnT family glycosyltransferase n=1 Tax=Haladaptatus sp. CMSO5 TaxID=3120514 RepID=UPI002FCE0002
MSTPPRSRTRNSLLPDWRHHTVTWTDVTWLSLAVLAAATVYVSYLATHQYPAYVGGLYIAISDAIVANGYALPERIPGYTVSGVPFAYPPFMFYVYAVIRDLFGVDAITLTRFIPGAVMTLIMVPYYFLARHLLDSKRQAGLAAIVFVGTPAVLRWHLSAGGIVRAPAFMIALVGAYTGIRLFQTGDRRWIVPGMALFGIQVLTHPTYTVFFAFSYLLAYAVFDRSFYGLVYGAIVAGGGILIAAPWWLQIFATHGPEIFLQASGTHHGLGGGWHRIYRQFIIPIKEKDIISVFYLAVFVAAGYALWKKRYFLAIWAIGASYLIGKDRFLFVGGAMLVAFLVYDGVLPAVKTFLSERTSRGDLYRGVSLALVALVMLTAVGTGVAFATSTLQTEYDHSAAQPATMDDHDREAMQWMQSNTPQDATFVVMGDTAEWVPLFTERTILVGPWGVEWTTSHTYYWEVEYYKAISNCGSASCVTQLLAFGERQPDYLYVPKGDYTVRGKERHTELGMQDSLYEAPRYDLVYENEGVLIYKVAQSPSQTTDNSDESTAGTAA